MKEDYQIYYRNTKGMKQRFDIMHKEVVIRYAVSWAEMARICMHWLNNPGQLELIIEKHLPTGVKDEC